MARSHFNWSWYARGLRPVVNTLSTEPFLMSRYKSHIPFSAKTKLIGGHRHVGKAPSEGLLLLHVDVRSCVKVIPIEIDSCSGSIIQQLITLTALVLQDEGRYTLRALEPKDDNIFAEIRRVTLQWYP